jgi:hypothetical protein
MYKAKMSYDSLVGITEFKVGDMHIIYNTSKKIKKIISILDYEDGFITFQTNIGEEYTDLKELVNNSTFDVYFINRFTNALNGLYLKDIKLESR